MQVTPFHHSNPHTDATGDGSKTENFVVQKNQHAEFFFAATNPDSAAWSRTWNIKLEQGASIKVRGVIAGTREQKLLNRLVIEHGKDSQSDVSIRAVLLQKAHAQIYGTLVIPENAANANGNLSERAILLDDGAHVDAVPEVEIRNQDVKAAHAASIGRVSPDQLFYLKSRGLAETDARRMIVEGFMEDQIRSFPATLKPQLRKQLTTIL